MQKTFLSIVSLKKTGGILYEDQIIYDDGGIIGARFGRL